MVTQPCSLATSVVEPQARYSAATWARKFFPGRGPQSQQRRRHVFRTERDPETTHTGPDHDLRLPGEQLDLAAGAADAVVQLVQQSRSQRHRVREPHGDVTASGPPGHGMPIQYLTDLFVPVQAVDQRDGRGDGGAAAAALPDRHSVPASSWAATSWALHSEST